MQEVCRKHGISDAAYYDRKSKYGDMEVYVLRRMKELEQANPKLKRMCADMALENRRPG